MSGFGGFVTGSTGGGFFGDKPPEQASGGFTLPTTTAVTTTSGLTFGTPTFGTGGTGLFGTPQQSTAFGSSFGAKPAQTGTGFTLTAPAPNTSSITFGTTSGAFPSLGVPANTIAPGFSTTVANTTAPTFGSVAPTSAPTFGSVAPTSAPTFGSVAPTSAPTFGSVAPTSAPSFGSVAPTSAPTFGSIAPTGAPTFGSVAPTSAPTFGSVVPTSAPTFGSTNLTLNAPKTTGITGFTTPSTTTTAPATFNFGLTTTSATSTPITFGVTTTAVTATTVTVTSAAPTLTFGVPSTSAATTSIQSTGFTLTQPTTTSTLTFGVPKTTKGLTFGTTTTFSGAPSTTTTSLGTGLFGTPKTTDAVAGAATITTSAGLGGIDNKQTTQGLSGGGTLEPKQTKEHTLPDPILQTLNEFQNFTKQQKSLSVEISHGSSKPLKKVQEDTEAMESLLTMITSGLTRNAIAVDKLKTETAQGLHQAEMAQRNHETPPGLDYDNSAPADYFNDLVSKFETDTVRLRVQIEASEKHLRSLTQSSTISPQELTLAMRRLHETLIVLAARVQALHTSVQSQKEQFKNLRRVYFKDDTNIFESETDQNFVKNKTAIYSLRSLTGPTPFSENPNTGPALHLDGLAMLASSTCTSIPITSTNASWMPGLQGSLNTSNVLSNFQPLPLPNFQLSKPPTGNKRSRH